SGARGHREGLGRGRGRAHHSLRGGAGAPGAQVRPHRGLIVEPAGAAAGLGREDAGRLILVMTEDSPAGPAAPPPSALAPLAALSFRSFLLLGAALGLVGVTLAFALGPGEGEAGSAAVSDAGVEAKAGVAEGGGAAEGGDAADGGDAA